MNNKKIYREFPRGTSQMEHERNILEFWDRAQIFKKVLEKGKNDPKFVFYEGPPTANGLPGVHHVLARTLKDIVCRYQTMRGYLVERKAGWDTHGLPVEIDVEKSLGLESKKETEEFGVEKFNAQCRLSVFKYVDEWEEMTRRIGYWLDMSKPYITCDPKYMESVWWLLAQFYNRGFMYRGHKVMPYCPRCGTGLSDHEEAQGYSETEDPSLTVRMKIAGKENEFFLVWTTTPWTLLSNVAVALHPEVNYVLVEHGGQRLWLAEPRLEAVFGSEPTRIIEKKKGIELAGIEYEPLFKFYEPDKKAWFAINAEYVTTDDGTGIVHIAPAFGKEDFEEGKRHDLPLIQLVEPDGRISRIAGRFAGKFFKDADNEILDDLEKRGILFSSGKVVHSYPFCWRCDCPLIQYARGCWYIKTTAFKDELLRANSEIKWFPPEIGEGRFGEWLRNNIDWAISRERYWATPLPIWICESCGKEHAIGSIAELAEMAIEGYSDGMDIHKPLIDGVILRCPVCGGMMKRVPDVIDCWFDSGAMPFAQVHYPFENEEKFERECFPAEFICEGVDQTRGWFYTLLAISVFIKGKSSYKRCLVNGLVLDKDGQKMSKSKGNAVDPIEVIERFGADPLRWFLVSTSAPWLPIRFDTAGVAETGRTFFDTLLNTYSFFALYANIDRWTRDMDAGEPTMMDRWLASRVNSLVADVRADLDEYQLTRAVRRISSFVVDELSNWFVRLSRKRFWGEGFDPDKLSAYRTLFDALMTVAKLIAPFAPMTAETIWLGFCENDATLAESVHLTDFPEPDVNLIDKALEKDMQLVERIVTMGRNARQEANLKVRQPLAELLISGDAINDFPDWAKEIISRELNVKSVRAVEMSSLFTCSAKPNFKTLGPRFGNKMKELSEIICSLDSDTLKRAKKEGMLRLNAFGEEISLYVESDLVLSEGALEGLSISREEGIAVALNTKLTPELVAEGHARELVNRIQNSRKNAGFEVTDRIILGIESDDEIMKSIDRFSESIKSEVLARQISKGKIIDAEFSQEWDVNGHKTTIYLKRVSK